MTPTERNLRAQLDAANIQIRSLERDVRELRAAIDIKTDEIERVRVILGPTAGRHIEAEDSAEEYDHLKAERAVLDASAKAPENELRLVLNLDGHPGWEVEHARAELQRRGIEV